MSERPEPLKLSSYGVVTIEESYTLIGVAFVCKIFVYILAFLTAPLWLPFFLIGWIADMKGWI